MTAAGTSPSIPPFRAPRPRKRSAFLPAALLVCLLPTACGGIPRPGTALETLVAAEKALKEGKAGRALELLDSVEEDSFSREDRPRLAVDLARAHFLLGEWWEAYDRIRDLPREHPSSPWLAQAEEIEFKSGALLAGRGGGFLFFTSDLSDAILVLEHFLLYYPTSRWLPDALRILGEAAYRNEDWDLAIERFSELLQRAPEGEWSDLASFRIAMAHYRKLVGPEYDLEAMENARRELASYLSVERGNESFVDQARRALTKVLLWIDRKNLLLADFYLRIDKPESARLYLQRILSRPDSPLRGEAETRLSRLPPGKSEG